jgi:hypothetical protein
MPKKCYIIAGPNGAGKTTFANDFLPIEAECLNFINADLIASGLSPYQPEKMGVEAGRIMFKKKDDCFKKNESFAFVYFQEFIRRDPSLFYRASKCSSCKFFVPWYDTSFMFPAHDNMAAFLPCLVKSEPFKYLYSFIT